MYDRLGGWHLTFNVYRLSLLLAIRMFSRLNFFAGTQKSFKTSEGTHFETKKSSFSPHGLFCCCFFIFSKLKCFTDYIIYTHMFSRLCSVLALNAFEQLFFNCNNKSFLLAHLYTLKFLQIFSCNNQKLCFLFGFYVTGQHKVVHISEVDLKFYMFC